MTPLSQEVGKLDFFHFPIKPIANFKILRFGGYRGVVGA